jgi:hypothetical protein
MRGREPPTVASQTDAETRCQRRAGSCSRRRSRILSPFPTSWLGMRWSHACCQNGVWMRVFLGATAVVVLIVGGFWFALSLLAGPSLGQNTVDAFTKSANCVKNDPSLSSDRSDAARIATTGLRTLELRWNGIRAVALFATSSKAVTRAEARLATDLRRRAASTAEINNRLLSEDNVGLFYVNAVPTQAAEAAIGSCVYMIRSNRFASFFGLNFPHTERPSLPGAGRER